MSENSEFAESLNQGYADALRGRVHIKFGVGMAICLCVVLVNALTTRNSKTRVFFEHTEVELPRSEVSMSGEDLCNSGSFVDAEFLNENSEAV